MMRLSFLHVLSALLLLLPGKGLAEASGTSDGRRGGSRGDDVAVSILVCFLLFLLLMLFFAWRRLSRETEGRYHPRHLIRGLILCWQEFWGQASAEELSQGYRDEMQSDEELGQQQGDDTEDEEQEQLPQADSEQEEEHPQQLLQADSKQEAARQLIPSEGIDSELHKEATVKEPPEEEGAPRATEGRAEALLSGLHSFSGTAAWEDSGKQLHVTAL